jgi:hypothetical protein
VSDPLPILMGPGAGSAETLMLVGAPDADGLVQLRTWTADDWSSPPTTRTERADALLRWLESQSAAGRAMNQSLYAVRLWLRGGGGAPH